MLGFLALIFSLAIQRLSYLAKKSRGVRDMFSTLYQELGSIGGRTGAPRGANLYGLMGVNEAGDLLFGADSQPGSIAEVILLGVEVALGNAWNDLLVAAFPDEPVQDSLTSIQQATDTGGALHDAVQAAQNVIRTATISDANPLETQIGDVEAEANNTLTVLDSVKDVADPMSSGGTIDTCTNILNAALTPASVTAFRNAVDAATAPAYGGDATNDALDDLLDFIVSDHPPS